MPEADASWGLCVDAASARYNILVLAASPHPNLNFSRRHHGFPVLIFIQSLIPCVLLPRRTLSPPTPRLPGSTCSSNLIGGTAIDKMTRITTLPRAFETSSRNDTVKPTSQRKGKPSDVHRCGTCFRTFNRREHRIRHERCRTFCTLTPAT
jgi:hypothetical protein